MTRTWMKVPRRPLLLYALLAYAVAIVSLAAGPRAFAACEGPDRGAPIPDLALQQVGGGFRAPVFVTGDGQGRLLVVEQSGVIRYLDTSSGKPGPVYLDIQDRVVSGGERGLLGLAFHPSFESNGRLFVNYTAKESGLFGSLVTRVSEFRIAKGRSKPDPDSERGLLSFEQPYSNHNGGMVAFGKDGFLYVGAGDGGAGDDPHDAGQRLDTLLGKMLRIDVDRPTDGRQYGIPANNPYRSAADARPEIYAHGLRNPWRFSFDRATGELYAGDVGQNRFEEISIIERGGNYGWRIMEGNICTPGVNPSCDQSGLLPPIAQYGRDEGQSVTGGYVYRGARTPALCGVYLYGDFVSGRIWGLRYEGGAVTRQRQVMSTSLQIASFGEDDRGEIYLVAHGGRIFQFVAPK